MADDVTDRTVTDEPTEPTGEPNYKELADQAAAVLKQREQELKDIKSKQSGSDKKVAELMEQLEELKTSAMKADERRKYEEEKREKQLASREAELKKTQEDFWKLRLLTKYGLNENLLNRIHGGTEAEIEEDIKTLAELMNLDVQKHVNERLTSTPKPTGGGGPTNATDITLEKFARMPAAEKRAFMKDNPEAWKRLLDSQPKESGTSN